MDGKDKFYKSPLKIQFQAFSMASLFFSELKMRKERRRKIVTLKRGNGGGKF